MPTFSFTGANSVIERTVFTNRGPIVKPPLPIASGSNLSIVSPNEIVIPTFSFNASHIGFTITISGSTPVPPSVLGRNDGTFFIEQIISSNRVKLENTNFKFDDLLNGAISWVLEDPRIGQFADDPSDVQLFLNSLPASVEGVIGLLGAVVLPTKPVHNTAVEVSYRYLNKPNTNLARLNSPEFNLNQASHTGLSGLPKHKYPVRADLTVPGFVGTGNLTSPFQPLRIGWRYKGWQRAYTAVLNDPNLLLLNVPSNRVSYPVLEKSLSEKIINYDPIVLPQNATDPWTLEGEGQFLLAPGGTELTIIDDEESSGPDSKPPFFTHLIDLSFSNLLFTAFRVKLDDGFKTDGVFTGVSFGISDGKKVAITGFLRDNFHHIDDDSNQTTAPNVNSLTAAINLVNELKADFNNHRVSFSVHVIDDTINVVSSPDATDLPTVITLVNEIKTKFNSHKIASGVHLVDDTFNTITAADATNLNTVGILTNELKTKFNNHIFQINAPKKIGVLKNSGPSEFIENWQAFDIDFSIVQTYRVARDVSGNISVFLGGGVSPIIQVPESDLPAISDIDGKFDPVQQIFFGAINREASSTSRWNFIRSNTVPTNSLLVADIKSVNYEATVVPELDSLAPWITIGQGGTERILSASDVLLLDSTSNAFNSEIPALGLSSGSYRGFLRFEPIITNTVVTVIDFRASVDYTTSGIDNKSIGLFVNNKDLLIHFNFLQDPQIIPATVTGFNTGPFVLTLNDSLTFKIDGGSPITVLFLASDTTIIDVVNRINSTAGVPAGFASNSLGLLQLTSPTAGSSSSIEIVGGTTLVIFGLIAGTTFGTDISNSADKVSYFGANFPDLDTPTWTKVGGQIALLLGRTLRIEDTSTNDFLLYTLADPTTGQKILSAGQDWKVDARLAVRSFTTSPSGFAGAFLNLDEGPTGKNIELQLAVVGSNKVINVVSFNTITNLFDLIAQMPFNWDDGQFHTYNLFKTGSIILLVVDGQFTIPPITYGLFNAGISGPSATFGSGSAQVGTTDLHNAKSIVDWSEVSFWKERNIISSKKYVGIYKGGSVTKLSSYYLFQLDWTTFHNYRLVINPEKFVSLFVDTNPVPVIAVSYNSLNFPPALSDFLKEITNDIPTVAFGSFNAQEISRSRWDYVRYSATKSSVTDRLIPPHQVLNQANLFASPDHLKTNIAHTHAGFTSYSGGTPSESLLADSNMASFTILNEGTPPIPMTQELETRGGLVKVPTQILGVTDPATLVGMNGFQSYFKNDLVNVFSLSAPVDLPTSLIYLNALKATYNAHLVETGIHVNNDSLNKILIQDATSLSTALILANTLKQRFNLHLSQSNVHATNDITNIIITADATNLASLLTLLVSIAISYNAHRTQNGVHDASVIIRLDPPSGVLYNSIKFFQVSTGETGHIAPFSDNDTINIGGVDYKNVEVLNYDGNVLPENSPGQTPWSRVSDIPANVDVQLVTIGPDDFLRYGTIATGTKTVYRNPTPFVDAPSLDFGIVVRLKLNSFPAGSNVDTGIYIGMNSAAGFSAAIGFDVLAGIRYVKVHDTNADVIMYRIPFNWGDGAVHQYRLFRNAKIKNIQLFIDF